MKQITKKAYDVIIIGAGPAGGQCARELANKSCHVLLVEKSKDFSVNSYSSGGAPLEILENYSLPTSTVGSYWNKMHIHSSQDCYTWSAPKPMGVILDF